MLRGWRGLAITIAIAAALFTGVVWRAVHLAPRPRGFSGLQFAPLSAAAAARTPLLNRGGAMVFAVMPDSPAEKARIKPGEVVAAIDGVAITSARQASDLVRAKRAGEAASLTLYDNTGAVLPDTVKLVFDGAPPEGKVYSVRPPRTLAKPFFPPASAAANAAWSNRIFLGATIRPLALSGLGDGQCNAFAPDEWRVAGHEKDNSLFHLMAKTGFQHAIYKSAELNGQGADAFVRAFLETTFASPMSLTPPQARPFGFVVRDFGNARGGAGFVLYRVMGNRIALWVAAVAGAEAGWAKPLVGAVALSMRCASPGAPKETPRDPSLLATRISMKCIQGACGETDFAAQYLTVLHLGYVHNIKGEMFLVHPHRDFWQDGAQGPGFYHQIGGENEKLYPGRIN